MLYEVITLRGRLCYGNGRPFLRHFPGGAPPGAETRALRRHAAGPPGVRRLADLFLPPDLVRKTKERQMRIVFVGAGDLTLETALLLIRRGHEVVIVITSYSIHYTKLYD